MSGPFGSSQWMYNSGGGSFYDYAIDESARFDGTSNWLDRTPSTTGNRKKWTLSTWLKRAHYDSGGSGYNIFAAGSSLVSPGNHDYAFAFRFYQDRLDYFQEEAASSTGRITTNRKFRDLENWFHLVFIYDSGNATSSDRFRIYINGERLDDFSTASYPSLNRDSRANLSGNIMRVGRSTGGFLNAMMAETHFLDGYAQDPTGFGETKNGIWVAKEYTGSYGTNGFYFKFDNSSAFGTDSSGNSNTFTANGFGAYDQLLESPTNNFMTFNPLHRFSQGGSLPTPQECMLRSYNSGFDQYKYMQTTFTFKPNTGKWYFECLTETSMGGSNEICGMGLVTNGPNFTPYWGNNQGSTYATITWRGNTGIKNLYFNDVSASQTYISVANMTAGDIWQWALDTDTGELWVGRNNTWYDGSGGTTGNPSTGANPSYTFGDNVNYLNFMTTAQNYSIGSVYFGLNAGQDSSFYNQKTRQNNSDDNGYGDFYYAPPTGFLSPCSANWTTPAINPVNGVSSQDYFDTILYTAATSNGTYTRGSISFTPDFTWIKNRDNVERHFAIDVNRGNTSITNKFLVPSDSSAEGANGVDGTTFSVTSTGYEFVETTINSGELFFNNRTYAGWNWLAGGSPSSNTNGSVTSTVSANQDSGFSVVTWTGTAGSDTIGHGLDTAPSMIITKPLSGDNWIVYHQAMGATNQMYLDLTNGQETNSNIYSTAPTSSVFTIGSWSSTRNLVAYCFADKEGHSISGQYRGNGQSDGQFVYTGFRPAFLMIKKVAAADWLLYDSKRYGYNAVYGNAVLYPAEAITEEYQSSRMVDLVSNGFKIWTNNANLNTSGSDYIYLAVAEQPFKYANAR